MEEKISKNENVIFCKYCGAKLPAGTVMCTSCGKKLDTVQLNPATEKITKILVKQESLSSEIIRKILYIFGTVSFIGSILLGIETYSTLESFMTLLMTIIFGFLVMIICFAFGNIVSNVALIADKSIAISEKMKNQNKQ